MTNSYRLSKNYLDIAIHNYEPTVKANIYETVAKSDLPYDDPYKAIEEYAISAIDFPKLGDAKRIEVNARRMMFSKTSESLICQTEIAYQKIIWI